MMRFKRSRSRPKSVLEALEPRELLTGLYNFNTPSPTSVLPVPRSAAVSVSHPIGESSLQLSKLDNDARYLTGQDRQGDTWTLTLHGPGSLIVSDTTPNDGVLDDDINTIQIVGSNPKTTYVTGTVEATAQTIVSPDTGIVYFHHLIAQNGVKSIVLNGFTLVSATTLDSQNSTDGVTVNDGTSTIAGQPNNTGPAIYLPGGVQTLSFHNILNVTDLAGNGNGADEPLEIQIGDPNTPLKVSPSIYLDGIFNTVLDSDASTQLNSGPQTTATVNILVNGNIHNLSLGSATQQTIAGGYEYNYPLVDVTGRTAVRATGVDHLKVVGSAKNLTLSRAGIAFQAQNGANTPAATSTSTSIFSSGFSGLKHLGTVDIGGTTDALGLDVSGGKIGRLRLLKGLGDPTGSPTNATQYGYNSAEAGYASRGLLGGLVVAKKINKVVVGAANLTLQTSDNPADQKDATRGQKYFARAGNALTNAAITSSGSIGSVHIVGDSQSSEIAAGYDYKSYTNGLEPVRAASKIASFKQRGDLIDSVVSASYRSNDQIYGNANDTAGPGKITGKLEGREYATGAETVLGNYGTGIYAKVKKGYLPPAEGGLRTKRGILTR